MNLLKVKEFLKKFYFLDDVNEEKINDLCEKIKIVSIKKDNILFHKGEHYHKGLYLIYEGKVQLSNSNFKRPITLTIGDVVGVMAFVGKSTYNADAITLEDTELIFLPDV